MGCVKDLNDLTDSSPYLDSFVYYDDQCGLGASVFDGSDINQYNSVESCLNFSTIDDNSLAGSDFSGTRYSGESFASNAETKIDNMIAF